MKEANEQVLSHTGQDIPPILSESSAEKPPLEEEPLYDRLWYVQNNQEFLRSIPSDLGNEEFDLMFFLVDDAGIPIYSEDLKSDLEEIYEKSNVRISTRIKRLRLWLEDTDSPLFLLKEHKIKGAQAFQFDVQSARILQVGEDVPEWPENPESEEITMIPGETYSLVSEQKLEPSLEKKREFNHIRYKYTTKRGTKEVTTLLPENLREGEYQLFQLLTKGIRTGAFVPSGLLNRELDEVLPGGNTVPLSVRITRLKNAFKDDPTLSRLIEKKKRENAYRFAVDEATFLFLEPELSQESITSSFSTPSHTELIYTTPEYFPKSSSTSEESRQKLFQERYPDIYTAIPGIIHHTRERLGSPSHPSFNDIVTRRINREMNKRHGRNLSHSDIRSLRRIVDEEMEKEADK